MIEKVVSKRDLKDPSLAKEDVQFWLTKTPAERIEAVEFLRKQFHGSIPRLQRVASTLKQT
jgi:hypothetical protein